MPKNWKYIKKLLEKEFLCEKLRGRITYDLTDYRSAPWYRQHFIMKYDDAVLLDARQVSHEWYKDNPLPKRWYMPCKMIAQKTYDRYKKFGVSKSTIEQTTEYIVEEARAYISHYNGFYGCEEIMDAIAVYLHQDVQKSLNSQEFLICGLAAIDRRCGKRSLEKLAKCDRVIFPDWLCRIFRLRFEAEEIQYTDAYRRGNCNSSFNVL